jgi:tight adherence protein C
MIPVLALAWALLLGVGLRDRLRPAPRRPMTGTGGALPARRLPSPAAALGAGLRRASGLGTPGYDRRRGRVVLVSLAAAVVWPPLVVMPGAVIAVTVVRARRRSAARSSALVWRELPEVAELLAVAVGAGCNPLMAVRAVARGLDGRVPEALADAVARTEAGARLDDALGAAWASLGEPARPLLDALRSTDRYGTPLLPALRRCADEARAGRRRRAEEAARRVPVRLLLPLCGCILPAFVLLTFVPLLAGSVGSLPPVG